MLRHHLAVTALILATACSFPAIAAETSETTGRPLVVALGDSLTEGYNVAPEHAWPALVEKDLRAHGWPDIEIVNAGVSGSTSASALARLKWQLRRKPDVLIVALGANDGLRGLDLGETRKNLAVTIDLAQDSGITVLLAGMMLPPNYGGEYTHTFAAVFTDLAKEKKVALVPFLLEGVAADPSLNLADGIHPNASGYEVVARTMSRHLRSVLENLRPSAKAPAQ